MNRTDDDLGRLLRETFADAEHLTDDRVAEPALERPRRTRLMMLAAAASVAAVLLVGGMLARSTGDGTPVAGPVGTPSATPTTPTTPAVQDIPGSIARPASAAQIYAAVLRREFTRERLGFKVLWVLDAPHTELEPMDAKPMVRGAPFDRATRTAIERALADLGPVRWVSTQDAAKTGGECGGVQGKGVILTVGEIKKVGRHVEVPATSWFGCLGGHWGTYRLDPAANGAWRVTGTVGPESVS